jgi:hypothetical protein
LSRVLFDVKNLTRAQAAFNLLNTLGIWLPVIAIVLLGVGVWVAKGHRRALVGAADVGGVPDDLPGRRPGRGAAP